jgi:hypothetical protein
VEGRGPGAYTTMRVQRRGKVRGRELKYPPINSGGNKMPDIFDAFGIASFPCLRPGEIKSRVHWSNAVRNLTAQARLGFHFSSTKASHHFSRVSIWAPHPSDLCTASLLLLGYF